MAVLHAREGEFYGRGVNLAIISIMFCSTAAGLVVSRMASRITTGRKFGLDDYAIIASMMFAIGVGISNCLAVYYGSGKHTANLSPHDLHIALQCFWATQISYKFTINLTKTSICLLYLRIFSTADKATFRRIVHYVMGYVIVYAFASIMATIFECVPIPRIWDKKIPGTCINLTAFWYTNAAANMIGDIGIFVLPLPVIRSLQLPSREKLGLMIVFSLGFFVCITSILRMTTLNTGSKAPDQTFGALNSTIWTTIECNTGIICACLPMLKKPLAALFPSMFPRAPPYSQYHDSNPVPRHTTRSPPPPPPRIPSRNTTTKHPTATPSSASASTTPAHSIPRRNSTDSEAFGMGPHDVQLGHITKTTSVNIQYAHDPSLPPAWNSNDAQHSSGVSELAARNYVYR